MNSTNQINKFMEDVKTAFEKAIGTSSSINEERDERSVENYVRTGGNTMENTTEPDPKGDLAINKEVGSVTNPNGNISVGAAPEGTVPASATIPSDATSAIAPSKTDEVNTPETVTKAEAGKCASCGQSLTVEKADEPKDAEEITKSADEAESKEEAASETPEDEKAEMKKSIWGGAFAPRK